MKKAMMWLVGGALVFQVSAAHAGKGVIQVVASFTNSMFPDSTARFELQMDDAGVVQNIRWVNPSYQPVPPDHKITLVAKSVALDTYQSYKTIVLRGGPIDYTKNEGRFVFGFMSQNGYLECPIILKKGEAAWEMFSETDKSFKKPIRKIHAIIDMGSGVQKIEGGLRCKLVPNRNA